MVKLDTLHIQYLPYIPYSKWWYGLDLMALRTSPHVQMMEVFRDHGFDWNILKQCSYVAERKYRRTGLGRKRWTNAYIKERVRVRYKIFKSIKKRGFKHQRECPVTVLEKPFWETRFGTKLPGIQGPEIQNGAGRCSAAYVLGYTHVPAVMVRDAHPGSGYWKRVMDEWASYQQAQNKKVLTSQSKRYIL